jgi:probable F420-dependent oxidoreductase
VSDTQSPTPWSVSVSSPKLQLLDEWQTLGKRLESQGYHSLLLADHTYSADPLLPLVAVAAATERLRIGTLVLNVGFWNPLLLARSAATLQLLSGNRLDLGIGAGWAKLEHDDIGMPFDSPKLRVEKLSQTGKLLRQCLHGEPIEPTPHYDVRAEQVYPPLDVAPRLLVGGHGPQLLRSCAPWADLIQLTGVTDDRAGKLHLHESTLKDFETRVRWIRNAAEERFESIELSVLVQHVQVTSSASETSKAITAVAKEFDTTEAVIHESPITLIGTPQEIADKLAMLRSRLGITHLSIFAPAAESFAAVVALLP